LVSRIANRSIRFKLLLYFVLIVSLSILTLGFWGSYLYKESIEEETNVHTIQMMNQVKNNIEIHLNEMNNIIYYLAKEDAVIEFMRADAIEQEHISELNVIVKERAAIYELRHPEIAGIIAVSRNKQFASNTIKQITRDPLTEEEWYHAAVSHPEQFHLFSHPIGRNIKEEPN